MTTPERTVVVVTEALDGERLDRAMAALFPHRSRAAFQRHIDAGAVMLNGEVPRRGGKTKVSAGDQISYAPPAPRQLDIRPEPLPLRILYEDEDVLVLDKEAGTVVHPAAGNWSRTLVQGVMHHVGVGLPGAADRPGVVHRLDRDTTGVIVFAKNEEAHAHLAAQFAERSAQKSYWAVALGHLRTPQTADEWCLNTWYGRDPRDRKKFSSKVSFGKRATSVVRVLQKLEDSSLVEVDLHTGRTHQIRVHLADLGHPLLGDRTYGERRLIRAEHRNPKLRFWRPALHALRLALQLPSGETRAFVASVPADLAELVVRLGGRMPEEVT
ncbi:MAG: RluA family pseudouridine synthase [Myxococcota bacterium]